MLETSFLLAFLHIFLNLVIPFIAGILFLWILFGNKFQGFLLYIYSWFSGIGVIFFFLFNFQFFHYGVGKIEYFGLLILLSIALAVRLKIKREKIKDFISSLKLKISLFFIKDSFLKLSRFEKIYFALSMCFLTLFISLSLSHTLSFPNYFDDSFGNWNTPAMNIFYDGGFKLFGEKTEILGHGRLGYPIFVPIYKALITDFIGYWNDIYSNIFQYLVFLFLILFTIFISYKHTKNIFYSIIPAVLITGLPLVYFHTLEGYMELPSATYSVLTIYAFYKYLEDHDFDFLILGSIFGVILASLKNDGLTIYLPGIIFSFFTILFLMNDIKYFFKNLIKKGNIFRFIFLIIFFLFPFIFIRLFHGLGLNPVTTNGDIGISSVHFEIFPVIKQILFNQDNYNVILLFIIFLFVSVFKSNKLNKRHLFILLSGFFIFSLFLLVFLFTANFQFVMDQTTVNRVFTMSFIIFVSYFSILFNYENTKR